MKDARGWQNMENRPTLTIFFSWIWLTPPPSLPHQETGKSYVALTRGYRGYTHYAAL
jgi:hypothetical protein